METPKRPDVLDRRTQWKNRAVLTLIAAAALVWFLVLRPAL